VGFLGATDLVNHNISTGVGYDSSPQWQKSAGRNKQNGRTEDYTDPRRVYHKTAQV